MSWLCDRCDEENAGNASECITCGWVAESVEGESEPQPPKKRAKTPGPNFGALNAVYSSDCAPLVCNNYSAVNLKESCRKALADHMDLAPFEGAAFPEILKTSDKLNYSWHVVRVNASLVPMLKIDMPCRVQREFQNCPEGICSRCAVVWAPWPKSVPKPNADLGRVSEYHEILSSGGGKTLMPRRTRCFDFEFSFSGRTHGIEAETPFEISNLYQVSNDMFSYGEECGPNMCLLNSYSHGRHFIMEHGDDERMMESLHDVICWSQGPSSRELELRWSPHLTRGTREIFQIRLPEGMYAMLGKCFQKEYTHAFPILHEDEFLDWCKYLERDETKFPDFPKRYEGITNLAVQRADYIKKHSKAIGDSIPYLRGFDKKPAKVGASQRRGKFREWLLERTSYTLRRFE